MLAAPPSVCRDCCAPSSELRLSARAAAGSASSSSSRDPMLGSNGRLRWAATQAAPGPVSCQYSNLALALPCSERSTADVVSQQVQPRLSLAHTSWLGSARQGQATLHPSRKNAKSPSQSAGWAIWQRQRTRAGAPGLAAVVLLGLAVQRGAVAVQHHPRHVVHLRPARPAPPRELYDGPRVMA